MTGARWPDFAESSASLDGQQDAISDSQASGFSWAGRLPGHWRVGNIRRFATMKTGHTPSRSVDDYWVDCSIPWFTLADVWQLRDERSMYVSAATSAFISKTGLEHSAAELMPAGTVMLSRTASVGFSGIMPAPMATSQDYWNWVCGPELLPEYLVALFRGMRRQVRSLMLGSTHQTIYQATAASIRIPVPPLTEQRCIVTYINRETSQVDVLIGKQQQLIETLIERRAAVTHEALGGLAERRRLKFMAEVTLGKMLDAGKQPPPDAEFLPYVRAANILKSGNVSLDDLNQMPYTAAEVRRLDLRRGDVLVIEGGAIGRPAYLHEDLPATSFQKTVNRVRPRPRVANGRFLFHALCLLDQTGHHKAHIDAVSMPHLTAEKLSAVVVPWAPIDVQYRLATEVDRKTARIDALIAKAEQFIALLRERRAALITAAVTGQIDVRAAS